MHLTHAHGGLEPRVEISKSPEQIRAEAAEAAAADIAALLDAMQITPDPNALFQQGTQLFWRHRDEITSKATTAHYCDAHAPCEDDKPKLSH